MYLNPATIANIPMRQDITIIIFTVQDSSFVVSSPSSVKTRLLPFMVGVEVFLVPVGVE